MHFREKPTKRLASRSSIEMHEASSTSAILGRSDRPETSNFIISAPHELGLLDDLVEGLLRGRRLLLLQLSELLLSLRESSGVGNNFGLFFRGLLPRLDDVALPLLWYCLIKP